MSETKYAIPYQCKRCGAWTHLSVVRTENPDYEGKQLKTHLQSFLDNVKLCPNCMKRYNYLAKEGRSDEFWKE